MSLNIAMWSGPRNISTAMMRAWENRPDCEVWDEPLYAAYLQDSGVVHPMQQEIITHHENDWQKVIDQCVGEAPGKSAIFYQKHMTHHMLPHYTREWLADIEHCFLLRHPRDVLLSYSIKREQTTLADIGIIEQLALYTQVSSLKNESPMVIDSADFLSSPEAYLRAICKHFDLPFYPSMLSWPAGKRDSDGVWGDHWYARVWESTGFGPAGTHDAVLPPDLEPILEAALPAYETLSQHCLRIC